LFLLQSTNFCFAIAKLEVRFDICKQKRNFFQKNVEFFNFDHEIYQYLTPDDVFFVFFSLMIHRGNSGVLEVILKESGYRVEDC